MEFRDVTEQDAPILYKLLQQRSDYVNISHRSMPSYANHIRFIRNNPYKEWKIIFNNGLNDVGAYYITDKNEIGIFIKKEYQNRGIGKQVLDHILSKPGRYLANINPRNKLSQDLFKKKGFKIIQYTYEVFK